MVFSWYDLVLVSQGGGRSCPGWRGDSPSPYPLPEGEGKKSVAGLGNKDVANNGIWPARNRSDHLEPGKQLDALPSIFSPMRLG
jgi:hypothetical protein